MLSYALVLHAVVLVFSSSCVFLSGCSSAEFSVLYCIDSYSSYSIAKALKWQGNMQLLLLLHIVSADSVLSPLMPSLPGGSD